MLDSPEVKFAVDAVREAGLLVRRVQSEMVTAALTKGDKSPVTVGDFAAQAAVAKRLTETVGGVLVGEESADSLREADGAETLEQVTGFVRTMAPDASADDVAAWIDRGAHDPGDTYWTLDPIDGTKGFLRGDQYAVALALVKDGEVQIGVLGCPDLADAVRPSKGGPGSLLLAIRGEGTRLQPLAEPSDKWTTLRVSEETKPANTRMLRSVEKGHTNLGLIDHFANALGVTADPVGMDSQAKYAALAGGAGEMLVRFLSPDRPNYREKVWDQAAGSLVIEEAGGRVSDLDGAALDFGQGRTLAKNRGVLATNGHLHEAALAALREVGA